MPIKKTHKKFIDEMKTVNPNIEIISPYIRARSYVSCRCMKCGHQWESLPTNLLRGKNCPRCVGNIKYTNKTFSDALHKINPDIIVLGEYKNAHRKILCSCLVCNTTWEVEPTNLLSGFGCPTCAIQRRANKRRKTHLQFQKELSELNPDIQIQSHYMRAKEKIQCLCTVCGFRWSSVPSNLLSGQGCPACSKVAIASKGEAAIARFLDLHNIPYTPQYTFDGCSDVRPLKFDFYIPSLNACIEYDGQQHFHPVPFGDMSEDDAMKSFAKLIEHDRLKDEFCKSNNIKMIRIPYTKYKDIDTILEKQFL